MAKVKQPEDNATEVQQLAEQLEDRGKSGLVEIFDKVEQLPAPAQSNFSYMAQGFIAGALCGK